MRKLLIATHGTFAKGIKESLIFILGECRQVDVLCAYTELEFDMGRAAERIVGGLDEEDELIVVADVFGGSVASAFSSYIGQKPVYVLCGVNFPMLLSLVTTLDLEQDTKTLVDEALRAAKEGIVSLNEVMGETIELEGDDF